MNSENSTKTVQQSDEKQLAYINLEKKNILYTMNFDEFHCLRVRYQVETGYQYFESLNWEIHLWRWKQMAYINLEETVFFSPSLVATKPFHFIEQFYFRKVGSFSFEKFLSWQISSFVKQK